MIEVRGIERHEVPAFRTAVSFGFGYDLPGSELEPEAIERSLAIDSAATMLVAVDGGRFVATFAARDFDLALPGGASVPMAGATMVTVLPTHRRRGLLTEMMGRHLAQAVQRRQVVAGLRASEETIYGRFGYGSATPCYHLHLPANAVTVPPPLPSPSGENPLKLRLVTADEAARLLPAVYDRHWRSYAGLLSRSPAWWRERLIADPEHRRHGATARRHVVAERTGDVAGWASYRQRDSGAVGDPAGTVDVEDVLAFDDETRRALWHYLAHVDLYPNVVWDQCPLDDPIFLEVDRPRRLAVRWRDTLWLRLLDPVRAFEARGYERDGVVTLALTDPLGIAAGTWRLVVEGGRAECRPAAGPAEVTLESRAAGAAFLGGIPLLTLARAGWAEGSADAVLRLDGMLRTARAPWSPEHF
ncbi:MAG: GNAT family N-acetyltransferase [Acidimicrobiales bacterium]